MYAIDRGSYEVVGRSGNLPIGRCYIVHLRQDLSRCVLQWR